MVYKNTLELIGNTPMIEVGCFDTGVSRLFLKLENQNPGGSIKDRIGLSMIEAAEKEGKIKPGCTLIEATAGNTGLGLALTAAKKGYNLLLVIPDKMSQEKILHLKALGAKIIITRSDVEKGHPEYYQDLAKSIADETPGSYYIDQFNNPANPLAHERTTGPEIWEQSGHNIDAVVVGIGSGGTIGGLTNFFKRVNPDIEIILADPSGSILADYVNDGTMKTPGSWLVEGIGEDFIPPLSDFSLVKKAYSVTDEESFVTVRKLLKSEGILAGSSSGTLITAALKYAKEQSEPKNIVTFVCDSGNKYLSKMFNDYWMIDAGFFNVKQTNTAADLISRKYSEKAVVTVMPSDTLSVAYSRMKLYEISQLPVLSVDKFVGIIDESDILLALEDGNKENFFLPVSDYMTRDVMSVLPDDPIEQVVPILKKGFAAVVKDETSFYGLITRFDFLNYLRRKNTR